MGSDTEYLPCRERTFLLQLVFSFEEIYIRRLRWLRYFLERLGRDNALTVWKDAFQDYDDELLMRILNTGWEETLENRVEEMEKRIAEFVAMQFPVPVEGVSGKEAREIIDCTPPFKQIRECFPTLEVKREIKFYEALHLGWDGLALIAEEMLERYGKEGELMVYDAKLAELCAVGRRKLEVEEFMTRRVAQYSAEPEEARMFSAALKAEVVKGTDNEVVTRITECEYARYYREHHPRVGYLMCCSGDNAAYHLSNKRIRLQRTTTLMEGGTECDFRVYALEEALVIE
jgi:hypothetical protein